ncbi:hypothetical protein V5F44_18190 [Xanthobacter sp. V2C-8]|uniref:hypothetical protein n=1 Tax=Xanthobacter albus TaxID=3119929 RepID=UPI003727E8AA
MPDRTRKRVSSLVRANFWGFGLLIVTIALAFRFHFWADKEHEFFYSYAAAAGASSIAILAIMATIDAAIIPLKRDLERAAMQQDASTELVTSVEEFARNHDALEATRKRMLRALHRD